MSRVLIIANSSEGLIQFRKELLVELVSKRFEVYVSVPKEELFEEIEPLGCVVIETQMSRRGINPFQDIKLIRQYYLLCKMIQPDVVLTYTIKPNIYGGLVCQVLHMPYIANITGLGTAIQNKGLMQLLSLKLYKYGLRKAKIVFFQNSSNCEYMREKGIISGCYEILPGSGVNLNKHAYEDYPVDKNGLRFLFVGRIMKDKGIEEYLECAKRVKQQYPESVFSIIGSFDEIKYEPIINALADVGTIKFWGQQKDVHSFMKSHHVLVQPSYHEGLSNVLLEAAACGRPVLASNIPGCMETFDEGISGFGFEPRNVESLVSAVRSVVSISFEDRKKMGISGRGKVEREFSRQIVVDSYLKEINRIIK